MRSWREVVLTPVLWQAEHSPFAGVIASPPVQWPLVSIGAGTPSLAAEALRGALPQIYDLDHTVFDSRAPQGWQVVHDPVTGELNVASPANPGFSREARPRLADDWLGAAERHSRVLLLVTDRLPEPEDAAELRQRLPMLAEYGQLYGAVVPFVSGVRRATGDDLEAPGSPLVILTHDPGGELGTLADLAASGMMAPEEARARAARISWAWTWEPESGPAADGDDSPEGDPDTEDSLLPAGARLAGTFRFPSMEAVRLERRDLTDEELASLVVPVHRFERDRVLLDYWQARLLTEAADARGGPESAPLTWLLASRRAIEAATVIVGTSWDLAVFEDAEELSRRSIEFLRQGRTQGVDALADQALVAAAELQLSLQGPPLMGGDQASIARTTCVTAEMLYSSYTTPIGSRTLATRVLVAVEEANTLLDEALQTAEGPLRARALALRADAGTFAPDSPYAISTDEMGTLAAEAWECQEIEADPALAVFLARIRGVDSAAEVDTLFSGSVGEAVERLGMPAVRSLISQGLALANDLDDREFRERVLQWADELPTAASPAYRRQQLMARLHCLPDDPTRCPVKYERAFVRRRRLRSREAKRWNGTQRLAARAHAVVHALLDGEVPLAWELMPTPEECEALGTPAWLLRADIMDRVAEQAAEEFAEWTAVADYAHAALIYAAAELFPLARAALTRAGTCVRTLPEAPLMAPALQAAAAAVEQIRPGREQALGHAVKDFVHVAVTRAHISSAPVEVLLALHRAAKGAEFAGAYGRHDPFTIPAALVHELARLKAAEVPHTVAPSPADAPLAQRVYEPFAASMELLLPLTGELTSPGRTDAEVERNMRTGVDGMLNEYLTEREYLSAPFNSDWGEFAARLSDRTVLVSWLAPAVPEARGGLVVLAVTSSRVDFAALVPETADGQVDADEPADGGAALAAEVHAVRQEVTDDPLFDDVTPEGHALLGRIDRLLPPEWLERWAGEGRDHLCLWPHGPLHHLPLHLYTYGPQRAVLADDFTVTAISGLASTARVDVPRPARTAVIASGSGGVGYGLAREDLLEEHAAAVAGTAGTTAIVGADATKRRLLAELETADTVHIAAHGALDPTAPWFHCLYLSGDEDDDGRVFAHDLLTADLRGVRLVTLAACESALGRYDVNDNLRGIPAALLLAGAQSLIACLWPVRPEPATYFFAEAYRALGADEEPRAAFRTAQRATRRAYPNHRDWGAFTFIRGSVEEAM
ncbi:CHAT domain-containing protein [Streptomyces sp. MBT62]|uniref:CHAT domain-containing protein n=1 Tax=Streptomyces sp. MBT62 TaxID=2800410 RepID=UPI00190B0DCF|nr:CHAT domain-containing protein [Streptomyces sp. MBT62]MBK3562694.1 CHAT domain-containing protein [Streptomyces sp. MBT62]